MPLFQPRNRIQILREAVARAVARSPLAGLFQNSGYFHVLAAAANEDAEQYVQMARLRSLFSIDKAKGSDLDERAKEIVPGTIRRRPALYATSTVVFSRPGTSGLISIPVGTQVGGEDAQGVIRYRTTSAGSIPNLSTVSAPIPVVATVAGSRANLIAGSVNRLLTRIPGITGVTNGSDIETGQNRESDESFVARIKAFVQALSRATVRALEGFARNVILADGRRVLYAKVVETILPTGIVTLYIDDGTGSVETYDSTFIGSPDAFLTGAAGGERDLFTTSRPIRDDGSFVLEIDTGSGFVAQVRGVDYELNPAIGQIELSTVSWPTGLPAAADARASYRFYTGLIAGVQRIIDGDPTDPLRAPGVRGGGIQVIVRAPQTMFQTVVGQVSVKEGFDPAAVTALAVSAIQQYINTLSIGEHVIAAEIVERVMAVTGMYNFRLTSLTGSSPAVDQTILGSQVARITSSSITLT